MASKTAWPLLRVGRNKFERRPLDAKLTSQNPITPGDIDHLKITGGKGIYLQFEMWGIF
jgi:hypothetical protein